VHARVVWTGATVRLSDVEARVADATITGSVLANLRGTEPVYELAGRIRRFAWKQGLLELEGKATTAGTGADALLAFRAEGKFSGRSLLFGPELTPASASGDFTLSVSRTGPHWKLTDLEIASNGEKLVGEGETQADGRVLVELSSPLRTLSWRLDSPGQRSSSAVRPTP
jgi:hypothetical protein